MPCRPTREEEAWAEGFDVQQAQGRMAEFDRQRGITIMLLRRLLGDAGLAPQVIARVLSLVHTEAATTVMPGDDPRAVARRGEQDAEINLCVARFALLHIVPLLPTAAVAPFAERIRAERRDHLHHRQEDRDAELAMLTQRIVALQPTTVQPTASGPPEPPEVNRLRSEYDRLRALTPEQLLANRDFSAGVQCSHCNQVLPRLPGMTATQVTSIAEKLERGARLQAVSEFRDISGLDAREGMRYITCPHGNDLPFPAFKPITPEPEPAERSPFRCRTCGKPLPPIAGLTGEQSIQLLLLSGRGRKPERERLIALLSRSPVGTSHRPVVT